MSETTDKIVKDILESYREDQLTTQIDKSSQPNRAVVVDVLDPSGNWGFPDFSRSKISVRNTSSTMSESWWRISSII